jgi:stearoyl-CoA desaturase (delta-9 desaturase)
MSQSAVLERQPEPSPTVQVGKLERRLTLLLTLGPFVAFLLAIPLFWRRGMSGVDLGVMVGTYLVAGTGVTVGFHRYFTHGSFQARTPVRIMLAIAGSLAIEGGIIGWVATHRRHHAFADKVGDPHSPNLEEATGLTGVLKGLWHAHIGWLFEGDQSSPEHYAPDLLKDSAMRAIDRAFPALIVASFALPALLGLLITRSLAGMMSALFWGGLVRAFFLHHATWSINSICHFYGRRPFESKDDSTNNWALSLVSFGESWHNNHHAFPTSARHGLRRWQLDMGAWIINGLEWLGLADDVRVPTQAQMQAKLRA